MDTTFLQEVDGKSGELIESCYHCHTCTAGCPVTAEMKFGPDRLLRLIELGARQRVLNSPDYWLCAACNTCTARCPNDIDVAKVMDTLRHISIAEGFTPAEPNVKLFHRLYLLVIRYLGRSHEALVLGIYKLLSRDLFSDLDSGLGLILRGKIPLIPRRIKDMAEIKRLFDAAEEADRLHLSP